MSTPNNAVANPHVREREYLFAIGKALMAEIELKDVLRVILHAATNLVASRIGAVILAEPEDKKFRVVATYGMPPSVLEANKMLIQGVSYTDGQVRGMNEIRRVLKDAAEAVDPRMSKSFGLPMYNGESLIGAIFLFHDHEYRITPDFGRFLQSFSAWAAIAVKNARLYEDVVAEQNRLNAIIQQSADGVMILDQALQITSYNSALSRMTGLSFEDVNGQLHHDIMKLTKLRTDVDLSQAVANGWPFDGQKDLYVEGDFRQEGGKAISLGITYAPLVSERGHMTNIIANVRDLTRYREEERLHKTFIGVVGHELKTPVSIIKGYAGTLQRDDVEWPREILNEYLHTIIEEADSLTELINNLLEASRLQSGAFSLDLHEDVALDSLSHSVAKKFEDQTDKHTLVVSFPADFPTIQADEKRLTQVLNNLVSNAIKYTLGGGTIQIRGELQENEVLVHIIDEGIGIPEHEQHRIFQQFARLDNALSRKTEGTGLGLFLTKAILDAHDGRIWFENNQNGKGTTFSFALPFEQSRE